MAFPAKFLEVKDIGRRVRVETVSGAVIEDQLVQILVKRTAVIKAWNGNPVREEHHLYLMFANTLPTSDVEFCRDYGFNVGMDQMVTFLDKPDVR